MPTTDLDRTNRANTGKAFEHELELVFRVLESRRIARIRKVDPPTRIVGPGRIVFLPNPFLDYAGAIVGSGRAVFVEAKSTSTHRLPIGRDNGLKLEQLESLREWARAGALVGVLWRHAGATAFLSIETLAEAVRQGKASLAFEEVPRLENLEDFLTPRPL